MVAYHYIEGYQPQAYNLTKTLSKNEAENVFTFVYEPVPEDTVTTETEVITRPDGRQEPQAEMPDKMREQQPVEIQQTEMRRAQQKFRTRMFHKM